jgi:carbamoyl-phosphate synthase large subunit
MRSTGEVMGIDRDFGMAYAKAQLSAQANLPLEGKVFISVKNRDKRSIVYLAKRLADLGFKIVATTGTRKVLINNGLEVEAVKKVGEGRPNIVDLIKNREIQLIINTPSGGRSQQESSIIRKEAVIRNIPYVTTLFGAEAMVYAIERLKRREIEVCTLQEYREEIFKKYQLKINLQPKDHEPESVLHT